MGVMNAPTQLTMGHQPAVTPQARTVAGREGKHTMQQDDLRMKQNNQGGFTTVSPTEIRVESWEKYGFKQQNLESTQEWEFNSSTRKELGFDRSIKVQPTNMGFDLS